MEDDNRPTEETATERKTGIRKQALLASFMTAVLLALSTFLLWSNALQNRDTMLLSSARIMSLSIARQVKQIVDNNLHVLETFADNWQDGAPTEERDYLSLATPLQARFPALQAVNWVTPNYIIMYVAPIKGNVPAMGADLKRHPLAGPVLDIALDQRRTQITPTLELLQGGRGFAVYTLSLIHI